MYQSRLKYRSVIFAHVGVLFWVLINLTGYRLTVKTLVFHTSNVGSIPSNPRSERPFWSRLHSSFQKFAVCARFRGFPFYFSDPCRRSDAEQSSLAHEDFLEDSRIVTSSIQTILFNFCLIEVLNTPKSEEYTLLTRANRHASCHKIVLYDYQGPHGS